MLNPLNIIFLAVQVVPSFPSLFRCLLRPTCAYHPGPLSIIDTPTFRNLISLSHSSFPGRSFPTENCSCLLFLLLSSIALSSSCLLVLPHLNFFLYIALSQSVFQHPLSPSALSSSNQDTELTQDLHYSHYNTTLDLYQDPHCAAYHAYYFSTYTYLPAYHSTPSPTRLTQPLTPAYHTFLL